VPLARSLHPEFGYLGSGPQWWRKVGLTLVFVVCGLVAAVSSVTVFVSSPEPDPLQAMALAPSQPLIRIQTAAPEATAAAAGSTERSPKAARIRPPGCRDNEAENPGTECTPVRKPKPLPAANERPGIAAVPIGHHDEAALLPSQAATPETAALPEGPATVEAAPTPTVSPPPARVVKKARQHSRQAHRREYLPSRSTHYYYGYARVW
jgi:hypothetical protein